MEKTFSDQAWSDYLWWYQEDKKGFKKINQLLKEIERTNSNGLGKTEALTGNLKGYCSKRIDKKHRLVYKKNSNVFYIAACRTHYGEK